jgi:hypothetical protein
MASNISRARASIQSQYTSSAACRTARSGLWRCLLIDDRLRTSPSKASSAEASSSTYSAPSFASRARSPLMAGSKASTSDSHRAKA